MSKSILYLLLLVSVLFSSCIPTQDLIYLQKKDGNEPQSTVAAVEITEITRLEIKLFKIVGLSEIAFI